MPPHIWTILAHFIHAPTENANHTFKVDGVRYLRAASTGIFFSPLKLFRHLPRFPLRRSPLAPRENLLPVCSVEGRERVSSLSHDREVNGVFSNMHYEPSARVIEMHVRARANGELVKKALRAPRSPTPRCYGTNVSWTSRKVELNQEFGSYRFGY